MGKGRRRERGRAKSREGRGRGTNGNEEENTCDHGCESCSFEESRVEITEETEGEAHEEKGIVSESERRGGEEDDASFLTHPTTKAPMHETTSDRLKM